MIAQLTIPQHTLLAYAIYKAQGKIVWFPDNLKGGARKKVLDVLLNQALIASDGTDWFVTALGYETLGVAQPTPGVELEATPLLVDPEWEASQDKPRTRQNSKQAEVIRMLQRPEGASIAQICEATHWQAHTVRGTLSGALKKKLGLKIVSDKQEGVRVYRII